MDGRYLEIGRRIDRVLAEKGPISSEISKIIKSLNDIETESSHAKPKRATSVHHALNRAEGMERDHDVNKSVLDEFLKTARMLLFFKDLEQKLNDSDQPVITQDDIKRVRNSGWPDENPTKSKLVSYLEQMRDGDYSKISVNTGGFSSVEMDVVKVARDAVSYILVGAELSETVKFMGLIARNYLKKVPANNKPFHDKQLSKDDDTERTFQLLYNLSLCVDEIVNIFVIKEVSGWAGLARYAPTLLAFKKTITSICEAIHKDAHVPIDINSDNYHIVSTFQHALTYLKEYVDGKESLQEKLKGRWEDYYEYLFDSGHRFSSSNLSRNSMLANLNHFVGEYETEHRLTPIDIDEKRKEAELVERRRVEEERRQQQKEELRLAEEAIKAQQQEELEKKKEEDEVRRKEIEAQRQERLRVLETSFTGGEDEASIDEGLQEELKAKREAIAKKQKEAQERRAAQEKARQEKLELEKQEREERRAEEARVRAKQRAEQKKQELAALGEGKDVEQFREELAVGQKTYAAKVEELEQQKAELEEVQRTKLDELELLPQEVVVEDQDETQAQNPEDIKSEISQQQTEIAQKIKEMVDVGVKIDGLEKIKTKLGEFQLSHTDTYETTSDNLSPALTQGICFYINRLSDLYPEINKRIADSNSKQFKTSEQLKVCFADGSNFYMQWNGEKKQNRIDDFKEAWRVLNQVMDSIDAVFKEQKDSLAEEKQSLDEAILSIIDELLTPVEVNKGVPTERFEALQIELREKTKEALIIAHEVAIEKLSHQMQIAATKFDSEKAQLELKAQNAQAMNQQAGEQAKKVEELLETHANELDEKIAEHDEAMDKLREAHVKEMKEVQASFAEQLQRVNEQLLAAEQSHLEEVSRLKSENAGQLSAQRAVQKLTEGYKEEIRLMGEQHKSDIEQLEAEHLQKQEQIRQAHIKLLEAHGQDKQKELQALRDENYELKREVNGLKHQIQRLERRIGELNDEIELRDTQSEKEKSHWFMRLLYGIRDVFKLLWEKITGIVRRELDYSVPVDQSSSEQSYEDALPLLGGRGGSYAGATNDLGGVDADALLEGEEDDAEEDLPEERHEVDGKKKCNDVPPGSNVQRLEEVSESIDSRCG